FFACCLLAAAVHPSRVLHFFFRIIEQIFVVPRPRLGTRNDPGDVWIFRARRTGGRIGSTDFCFVASAELFLLALLTCAFTGALLLGYFRSARHRVPSFAATSPGQ